jgi:hypothetical protein
MLPRLPHVSRSWSLLLSKQKLLSSWQFANNIIMWLYRISNSSRILGVLPVSRPGVPLAIIIGSIPSVMELMPDCMARPSDGLSAAGGRQVGTGDVSKGCSSRMFSCIKKYRLAADGVTLSRRQGRGV